LVNNDSVALVCSVPSTKLCVSVLASGYLSLKGTNAADESLIAIGSADGSVSVFRQKNLSKVLASACHDFPVTGLSFYPELSESGFSSFSLYYL
jgi:hypothetical protein